MEDFILEEDDQPLGQTDASSDPGTVSKTVSDYDALDDIEHVLMRPNVYIDSVTRTMRKLWMFAAEGAYIGQTDIPLGLERLFMELVANFCDHLQDSRRHRVAPGEPVITLEGNRITITSHGIPVPIEIVPKFGIYLPQMIFGMMKSGSNFDDKEDQLDPTKPKKIRHGAGANGIGAKATNIFSRWFQLRIINHLQKVSYTQTWTNNMRMVSAPELLACPEATVSQVSVSYEAELWRFGYGTQDQVESQVYPPEAYNLWWRHAAEASFTCKVPVHFDTKRLNYSNIVDYAKLYFGNFTNYLTYYQWEEGTPVTKAKDGYQCARNGSQPLIEMIVVDRPQGGKLAIGMANCIVNMEGGVHVDAALRSVLEPLVAWVNAMLTGEDVKKKKKGGPASKAGAVASDASSAPKTRRRAAHTLKEAAPKKPAKSIQRLTVTDGEPYLGVIISCHVPNPDWGGGNSKHTLRGPPLKITLPEKDIQKVKKWEVCTRLQEILRGRGASILSKTDGNKATFLGDIKADEATMAGTKNSMACTLAGLEGDSAMTYFAYLLSYWPGGRATLGGMPFRGKLINALKNDDLALANNAELILLKKMLGIRENTDYRIEENRKRLRYGHFLIMTDADVDGSHIKGLMLAMFAKLWGSLLDTDFVQVYQTPVKRALSLKGSEIINFYFEHEVEAWLAANPSWRSRYEVKHFKGLGGSSKAEVASDYRQMHRYGLDLDAKGMQHIRMAFGAGSTGRRKQWLAAPPATYVEPVEGRIKITDFVNCELKLYALHSLTRHIPRRDGMRTANRKAVFAALQRWRRNPNPNESPMTSFVATVLEKAKYVNGTAISDVIKRMAMSFVGGRNVPEFIIHSGAGTRIKGGKDAAADRYLSIKPNAWWLNGVYRPEDDPILEYTTEGGDSAEPVCYYPVIPMSMCNENWSVATGYSSFIPAHHPLDLIDYYLDRLQNICIRNINPWYRGFKGELYVVDRRAGRGAASSSSLEAPPTGDEPDSDEDDLDRIYRVTGKDFDIDAEDVPPVRPKKSNQYALISRGKADISEMENALVTELPVGVWTKTYKRKLITRKINGEIRDYKDDKSNDTDVWFDIRGFRKYDKEGNQRWLTLKDLGLVKSYGLTNLVLIDDDSLPVRFGSLEDILDDFYKWRLPLYWKRKHYMLQQLEAKVGALNDRIAFIKAVNAGQLVIVVGNGEGRDEAEVYADIERLGLNKELYKEIRGHHYNKQQVAKLTGEMDKLMAEGRALHATSLEQLWMSDLEELRAAYVRHYGDDRPRQELPGGFILEN